MKHTVRKVQGFCQGYREKQVCKHENLLKDNSKPEREHLLKDNSKPEREHLLKEI